MKQRICYIDSAKGIGILIVVFAHVIAAHKVLGGTELFLTSFHMPVFFVFSGMFFSNKKTLKDFIIGKMNRLLVPFFFFYVIVSLLPVGYYCYRGIIVEKLPNIIFGPYNERIYIAGALWFLVSLFICYILFWVVSLTKRYWIIALLSIVVGVLGFLMGEKHVNLPLWIDTSLTCMPYFGLGYILKNCTRLVDENRLSKYNYWLIIVSVGICLLTFGYTCYRANHFELSLLNLYICGIAGFFIVFFLAKSQIGELPLLQYLGENSMTILCIHQVLMTLFAFILGHLHIIGILAAAINFLATMTVCYYFIPIMDNYLPYITGQKALFGGNRLK